MKTSLVAYDFRKLQKKVRANNSKIWIYQRLPKILKVKKIKNKKWERERRVILKENNTASVKSAHAMSTWLFHILIN
jgi:hypothetical protein